MLLNPQTPSAGGASATAPAIPGQMASPTGETFLQRMKRIQGQQASSAAGVPQQGQQVSPYAGGAFGPWQQMNSGGQSSQQQTPQMSGRAFASNVQPATPVSGDGTIPPPQPQAQAAAPAGPMTAPQTSSQPGPGQPPLPPGWTYAASAGGTTVVRNQATGQMLPTNHPAWQQILQQNGMTPGQNGQPAVPGSTAPNPGSTPTFPGGIPATTPPTVGPYDLGNPTTPSYQGTDFSGVGNFQAPKQEALTAGQTNLASAILGNPESMSPDVIAALQNANKEQALMAQKQQAMQIGSSAAARGLAGGGSEMGDLRRLGDTTTSNILAGNRDIATQAAQTNFQNRLQASGAINDILNSALNRAATTYGLNLQGRQATAQNALQEYNVARQNQQDQLQRGLSQFGINQAVAGQNLDAFKQQMADYFSGRNADLSDKALSANTAYQQGQLANAGRGLDIQSALGQGGLNLENRRLDTQNNQFQQNYGLNIMDFLERQREANNNLGYNYSALNQNGQNATLAQIMSILNSGG